MKQWLNPSLQRKISSLLVILLSFLLLVIVYSIWKLKLISAEMHEVAEVDVPLTGLLGQLETMQLKQHLLFEQFRLRGLTSPQLLTPERAFAEHRQLMSALLNNAEQTLARSLAQHQVRIEPETHQQLLQHIQAYHQHSDAFEADLATALQQADKTAPPWRALEEQAAELDRSVVSLLQQMQQLTLTATRYTDKHETEFMLVNAALGIAAFAIGLYLTIYILQVFRARIGRIKQQITRLHQSLPTAAAPSAANAPLPADELAELEQDLLQMAQRLASEISNRAEIEQQLLQLATRDKLTGAYNRHKWEDELQTQLALAARGQWFSLIVLDVDHFKKINDQYGHAAGDQVLQLLTATLSQRLRKTDLLFRLGGEEFAILLPQQDLAAASALAESLRQLLAALRPVDLPGFTASFGVSQYQPDDDANRLLKRADLALYQAKQSGRNRVQTG